MAFTGRAYACPVNSQREVIKLRVAGMIQDSIVDGPGFRFTLFTQGCPHNCEGCHNPETHDPNGGSEMSTDEIIKSSSQIR